MAKKYDVIVVGAGPAGLVAAKTAGEDGLNVALLERKTDITDITRACAMMFVDEKERLFGERMYFSHKSKKMVFPVNGFAVAYEGPYKNFYGKETYSPDGKHRRSTEDYEKRVRKGDEGRLSVVFDKGVLLEGLLEEAEGNGVDIVPGIEVVSVKKKGEGVQVVGNNGTFEAPFAIAADGNNSRIAQVLGLNKDRAFYCTVGGISVYASGVRPPRPATSIMIQDWNRGCGIPIAFYMVPSPYADEEHMVFAGGLSDPRLDCLSELDYFMKEGPFSSWFTNSEIRRITACVRNFWAPVAEPFKDNVVLAGDATWSQEVEMTGAMMCGWKAAHAVATALRTNQVNRDGIMGYLDWWRKSFPESHDYRTFFTVVTTMAQFAPEDLNYLYTIRQGPLSFTLNPYRGGQGLKEVLPRIEAERPQLAERLRKVQTAPLEEMVAPLTEAGFPNR